MPVKKAALAALLCLTVSAPAQAVSPFAENRSSWCLVTMPNPFGKTVNYKPCLNWSWLG